MELKEKFLSVSKNFVDDYKIDDSNRIVIEKILKYFAGVDSKELPLSKGLLIKGSVGSGKTLIFKIIQKIISGIAINNVRDVVSEFNIGKFTAGVDIQRPSINTSGSGTVVTIGIESTINGAPYSIQQIDVHALLGRLI